MSRHSRCRLLLLILLLLAVGCTRSPQAREAGFLRSGAKYLQKKDYARAVLQFQNALQLVPSDADAYYQLGMAYLGTGALELSAQSFRKAIEQKPGYNAAQLRLAELESLSRNRDAVEEARKRAGDVLRRSPENADALNVAGLADLRLGQVEEGEKLFEQALAKAPAHLQAAVNLARARLLRKDIAGAEAVLQNAVARLPRSAEVLTALGQFYRVVGRPGDAEQQFLRAIAIDPRDIPALIDLGQIQWESNRLDKAGETWRRLSGISHDYRLAHVSFLSAIGDRAGAIVELQSLSKADPDDREVRTALVSAYLAVNRTRDAGEILNAALKKSPRDPDALLQRSRIYLARRGYRRAEADVTLALSVRPESAEAHYVLSKLHEARGEAASRRQELSEALSRDPHLAVARLELAGILIGSKEAKAALILLDQAPTDQRSILPLLIERNWAWLSLGEDKAARGAINQILAATRAPEIVLQDGTLKLKEHNYIGAVACAAEVLNQRADDVRALDLMMRAYAAQGNPKAGIVRVREYAARVPAAIAVQRFLAGLLMSNGKREEAEKVLHAAIAANPGAVQLYLDLADFDLAAGRLGRARGYLSRMLPEDTPDGQVQSKLATLEIASGNYPAAIEHYRKVLQLNPRDSLALNNLAYLLCDFEGRPDEALPYARNAKELSPESATADDTLGWIYYRKGLYELAVPYLESAISRDATARHKYHLAMAWLKLGERAKGKRILDAALRLDSSIPEALAAKRVWQETSVR
jgi:tetratricopeptide (TPR) repeat protein